MNIDTKRLKTYCISNRGIISFLWCRSILVSPKSVVFWNIFEWWCNVWPRAFLPRDRKEIAVHTFRVRQRQDGHPVICVLHSEIWEDNFLKLCCHSSVINVFQLVLCVMSLLLFLLFFFFLNPLHCLVLRSVQGPVVSASLSCVPRSTLNVSTFLLSYNQLISGKLERFMADLENRCTSNWHGNNFICPSGFYHLGDAFNERHRGM